jgi:hypothetical protein
MGIPFVRKRLDVGHRAYHEIPSQCTLQDSLGSLLLCSFQPYVRQLIFSKMKANSRVFNSLLLLPCIVQDSNSLAFSRVTAFFYSGSALNVQQSSWKPAKFTLLHPNDRDFLMHMGSQLTAVH